MTTSDVSVRWTGHFFAISGSAQNGNNTREADIFRRRGGRTENHDWGRINELGPVMFADAKNIQTDWSRAQSLPADSTYAGHDSRRRSRVRIPSLPPFPSRRFNDVGEVETRQQAMHRGAARVLDTRANLESQVDVERDRARWYAPLFKRILMMNEPNYKPGLRMENVECLGGSGCALVRGTDKIPCSRCAVSYLA
jgi:hypothetical protein